MQVLLNLLVIYIATNVEWLLHAVDVYILHPTDEITGTSTVWIDDLFAQPLIETAVFAAVFYALKSTGVLKINSRIGLAVAVIASDILYVYAYQPLLERIDIDLLQSSFLLRVIVFIAIFAALLIFNSYIQNISAVARNVISKFWPIEDISVQFLKHYAAIFFVSVAIVSVAMAGLLFISIVDPEFFEDALDLGDILLLTQVIPALVAPLVYLILRSFHYLRQRSFENLKDTVFASIFAHVAMLLFILPAMGVMSTYSLSGKKGVVFFVLYMTMSFSLGASIYIFKDIRWYKLIFQILGVIVGVFFGIVVISNMLFSDPAEIDPAACESVAKDRASKAMAAQEQGYAKQKSDYDSYFKTFLELCERNRI